MSINQFCVITILFALYLIVESKAVIKGNTDDDDDLTASELIDCFLERARANIRHHHKPHRRHKSQNNRVHVLSADQNGKEYVNCIKSNNGSLPTIKRCYRPDSEDMRVGCYAVWDIKKQLLVQDCWMQQAISMNNCQERRCEAKKSTFCCCYGHNCNDLPHDFYDMKNNSYDNL